MAAYVKTGNNVYIHNAKAQKFLKTLGGNVYTAKEKVYPSSEREYWLEGAEEFSIPAKLYGKTASRTERIINTFLERPGSTGVMLDGAKGSGKTLQAKHIAMSLAKKHNIPTIMINQTMYGTQFNQFIQDIKEPAMIFWDEFEKMYNWSDQDKILTLLDGVCPTKKLFVITSNNSERISSFITNRPGRIYYSLSYDEMPKDEIEEYCKDNLQDLTKMSSILKLTEAFPMFNFDMLQAIIEEMNRYNETVEETLKLMNIFPEGSERDTYKVILKDSGGARVLTAAYQCDPFDFTYHVNVKTDREVEQKDDELILHGGTSLSSIPQPEDFEVADLFEDEAKDSVWGKNASDTKLTSVNVGFTSNHFVSCDMSKGMYIYEDTNTGAELQLMKNSRQQTMQNIHLLIGG